MAAPNPTKKSVSDIKSALLQPALTSHFLVYVQPPSGNFSNKFLPENGLQHNIIKKNNLVLMCSDATLPGSSFTTHESNNDFHGTTERFAYRRVYDDRIDLSFYVDAEDYYTIRFFEVWMKYIADETKAKRNGVGARDSHYSYRFRYPDGENGYRKDSALSVIKFERDYKKILSYEFVKPYPISIQSMPISYDSSSLLKCTVSMNYIRYIVNPDESDGSDADTTEQGQGFGDPALDQAVQRALDPLSGSGFSNPVDEARFQRLNNNPEFTPGFSDSSLNSGYNAIFGPQTEVTVRDFQ
jgi:hypothetical protein